MPQAAKSFTFKKGLDRETVKSIYDRTAGRYDKLHGFLTAGSDDRGRRLLVEMTVKAGNDVLDAGGGTGTTAIHAAQKAGKEGRVVLFDLSEGMLEIAQKKIEDNNLSDIIEYHTGDILNMPFDDETFDVVLSTYSLCPMSDPERGVRELYRVLNKGGLLGVAHSAEPENMILRWLSNRLESVVWRFPMLSLGCRAINVLPCLRDLGAEVIFEKKIGVPLWPFEVFVVKKPEKTVL